MGGLDLACQVHAGLLEVELVGLGVAGLLAAEVEPSDLGVPAEEAFGPARARSESGVLLHAQLLGLVAEILHANGHPPSVQIPHVLADDFLLLLGEPSFAARVLAPGLLLLLHVLVLGVDQLLAQVPIGEVLRDGLELDLLFGLSRWRLGLFLIIAVGFKLVSFGLEIRGQQLLALTDAVVVQQLVGGQHADQHLMAARDLKMDAIFLVGVIEASEKLLDLYLKILEDVANPGLFLLHIVVAPDALHFYSLALVKKRESSKMLNTPPNALIQTGQLILSIAHKYIISMWNTKCSNRLIDMRLKQQAHLRHLRTLCRIKSQVNNSQPRQFQFLRHKAKAIQLQNQRFQQIELENTKLVEKMITLSSEVQKINRGVYFKQSLNSAFTKCKQRSIDQENSKIVVRLQSAKSKYSMKELAKSVNNYKRVRTNLSTSKMDQYYDFDNLERFHSSESQSAVIRPRRVYSAKK